MNSIGFFTLYSFSFVSETIGPRVDPQIGENGRCGRAIYRRVRCLEGISVWTVIRIVSDLKHFW